MYIVIVFYEVRLSVRLSVLASVRPTVRPSVCPSLRLWVWKYCIRSVVDSTRRKDSDGACLISVACAAAAPLPANCNFRPPWALFRFSLTFSCSVFSLAKRRWSFGRISHTCACRSINSIGMS